STSEVPTGALPDNCREEMYPCTRMYSVHKPIKRCIGGLCLYSLPRVYVINREICMRTVCQQDEYLKAELCRELSGWPKRIERSSNRKRCRNRRGNPETWANKP
uniref:Microfibril associated protein 5 n=1 Tax=Anabas testudineus TaxID=64144 RepID=A0A7N6BJ38_ANATE